MREHTPTEDLGLVGRDAGRPRGGGAMRELWLSLPFTALLFAFWLVLSGRFDAAHLLAGAACAGAVSLMTGRLLRLPPALGPSSSNPLAGVFWPRFVGYLPWLTWQVLKANLSVARIVLHPRMPINPCLVRVENTAPYTLARLVLANSITLTPGTVTLDVDAKGYLVHALTSGNAVDLEKGATVRHVEAVFMRATPESAPEAGR